MKPNVRKQQELKITPMCRTVQVILTCVEEESDNCEKMCQMKSQISEMLTVSFLLAHTQTLSYRCAAAALLPGRTAAAGLLLAAALQARCSSETAAHSRRTGHELILRDHGDGVFRARRTPLLPAAGWCNRISPRWGRSPSASGSCSQTEAAPSQTPWGPW